MDSTAVKHYLLGLQERIVTGFEKIDGKSFLRDEWTRPDGSGGGISCIIEEGDVIERGGVAFSHVTGDRMPVSATQHRPELAGSKWEAMGISLVMHPKNPYAPTSHCNVRMFMAHKPDGGKVFWFGGGMDLTPYYGFEEDVRHFHLACKDALTPFDPALHPKFKKWCDDYFFLKHRNEPRGSGGIFFDDWLNSGDWDADFAFTQDVGRAFLDIYPKLVRANFDEPWNDADREEQLVRRGRYVEFNLLYDRGTTFGLKTGGNVDSILSSMPPVVKWP